MKTIYLLVGSIGSGKTVVGSRIFSYEPYQEIEYIGSDVYKRFFFDTKGNKLSEGYRRADKLVEYKMYRVCKKGNDFIYELCPTAQHKIDRIALIKEQYEYNIVSFFIGTSSVDINIERTKKRYDTENADTISEEKVRTRYFMTMDNIGQITKMSETVYFIDNSDSPNIVAYLSNNDLHIFKHVEWFDKYILNK
ncbi:MAG: zeta toxin family protein [Tannerella sp.]|jgi:predicted ABC-type ATPase|nr:zeta toxin family protein [Tannerella sp.]